MRVQGATILELFQGALEIGEGRLLLQFPVLVLAQLGQQLVPLLLEEGVLGLKCLRLLVGSNAKKNNKIINFKSSWP